jgi:hypothetical protein
MATKVFWTGVTAFGCAGKFTTCFNGNEQEKFLRILTSANGGSCVGMTLSDDEIIAQKLPCGTKLFLACRGHLYSNSSETNVRFLSKIFLLFEEMYTSKRIFHIFLKS